MTNPWYTVENVDEIPSPSLLIYPDRVEENIRRMIHLAGGVQRLRPHMKTNKLPEVIRMHLDQGITKFKCATIAEAEMIAACEAPDVLMAYQPVGPNVERFVELVKHFPDTAFSALADDADTIRELSRAAVGAGVTLSLFLDLDVGMHRTGVAAGPDAVERYRLISTLPGLRAAGLHAYDGHLHETDLTVADEAVRRGLRRRLSAYERTSRRPDSRFRRSWPEARRRSRYTRKRTDVECSPGTSVFWDWSYTAEPPGPRLPAGRARPDAHRQQTGSEPSLPGSRPQGDRVGEPAASRVSCWRCRKRRPSATARNISCSKRARAGEFSVGSHFYGMPWHICPTVALHNEAVVINRRRAPTADGRSSAARGRSPSEHGVRPRSDPG